MRSPCPHAPTNVSVHEADISRGHGERDHGPQPGRHRRRHRRVCTPHRTCVPLGSTHQTKLGRARPESASSKLHPSPANKMPRLTLSPLRQIGTQSCTRRSRTRSSRGSTPCRRERKYRQLSHPHRPATHQRDRKNCTHQHRRRQRHNVIISRSRVQATPASH